MSLASVNISDVEKSAKSLLLALMSLAFIAGSTWVFGALSVAQPFSPAQHPHQELVFGVMFSLAAVSLGVFVLVYFVISRSDVQQCFAAVAIFAKARLVMRENGASQEATEHDECRDLWPHHQAEAAAAAPGPPLPMSNNEQQAHLNYNHLRRGYIAPVNSEADYRYERLSKGFQS